MANQKLNQIYVTNPALTLGSNDLIYIMQSPYGSGTDAAMIGSVFNSLYGSPLTTKGDIYGYSTTNARLAVASGDGKFLQVSAGAATGLAWSTATIPSTATGTGTILRADGTNWVATTATYPSTTTVNQLLYSSSANVVTGLATANNAVLITSAGGVPSLSTTLPSGLTIPGYQATITPAALTRADDTNVTLTLGGTPASSLLAAVSLTLGWNGQLALTRGGTNASLVASNGGMVYSDASGMAILAGTATAGKILQSGATAAPTWSTPTYPGTSGTAGKVLVSDGTNNVYSTPTFPNASATARKMIVSDGTNWVASTETWAVPGTSGNVLTSNGTNWVSSAATSNAVLVAGTGTDSIKTTFGNDATATRGIRIGKDPSDPTSAVIGDDGIGIGSCSYVGTNAVVIGKDARGQGTDAICIGNTAKAGAGFGGGSKSIAIGYLASTSTFDNAMMLTTTSSQPPTPSANGEWILSSGARMRFYIDGTQAVNIGTAFDLINFKGTADQSYSLQTPSTGFSITIGAGVKTLILNPAGTLATGTITMPASPINGQEIRVTSSQEVTALTVSANAGQTISNAPTTLVPGIGFTYIYNLSGTNWYRTS